MQTPFFDGFHRRLFGRPKNRLGRQVDALGQFALDQLRNLFGALLPNAPLSLNQQAGGIGKNSRERIFTPMVSFWGFLSQVLTPGSSCREALSRIQAFCRINQQTAPGNDTSVWCKARRRLEQSRLEQVHKHVAGQVDSRAPSGALWKGRRTLLADATTASMPDTPENQEKWPQHANQKEGCGFPTMKIVGLFSLASCALLDFARGALTIHENDLLYKLKGLFRSGDIFLGDRLYCTFANVCWLKESGVDLLVRKNASRGEGRTLKRLGADDRIVEWKRPTNKAGHQGLTKRLWDSLEPALRLREVRFQVKAKGYRTRDIILITTLLDADDYPAEELADLYFKRWGIELWFDDIKTSMQMDVLRCKCPEMIEKLLMHMIAYNLIRSVMQDASTINHQPLEELSFKGTVDRLKQWIWPIMTAGSAAQRNRMSEQLLVDIASDKLPQRPGRYEPRARKRRPKAFPVMVKPREEYRDEFLTKREEDIAAISC